MNDRLEDIYNFLPLSDRVATAGQPTKAQYPAIAAAGYRVVINLALSDSSTAIVAEAEIATDLGIEYLHIPVSWDAPTLADFQQFVSVMDRHRDLQIFVHCAANKRVSAFMYLYRQLQGIDRAITRQDLAKIWTPNDIWQDFITAISIEYQLPLL